MRYPLDAVLGSVGLVRLVRVVLHEVGGPVSVTDAARLAGLSPAGARKSLESLERAGLLERVGSGRAQKYGLRESNPFTFALDELFRQEEEQYESLLAGLRGAVSMPEVSSAWLREPVNDLDVVSLDVVVDVNALEWIGPELRTRILESEERFDVIVEVNTHTRADAPVVPEGATMLWGGVAAGGLRNPRQSIEAARSDERSLRMAQVISDLIRTDPSLVRRALQHTRRLLREGQGTANADIAEWQQLLEVYSADRLRALLVSDSSRAQRLRRSSPFLAVLTPDERDRVFEAVDSER